MFADLEGFVETQQSCRDLSADVGEQTGTDYRVQLASTCDAVVSRWVTPEIASENLLRSRLLAVAD